MAILNSSFRDPSGYVFEDDGVLYRTVNPCYRQDYEQLTKSKGLYEELSDEAMLIAHEEVSTDLDVVALLRPERVPYVSYPFEWSFGQLKDAALLTLDIQERALKHQMSLKDASSYNVQFIGCAPIFIDTLSFQRLDESKPWPAYRQFCQHFLGPLMLMASGAIGLKKLMLGYIDGLPVELTSKVLPRRSYFNYSSLAHIHLHRRSQNTAAQNGAGSARQPKMNRTMHVALIASLRRAVERCRLKQSKTEWSHYYDETNYSSDSMDEKQRLVHEFVSRVSGKDAIVHDFGANTGKFSRLVAAGVKYVVAHDIDELAVEASYAHGKKHKETNFLPLTLDLTNPSPAIGWNSEEREAFRHRASADTGLALALIHHLVIANNTPFEKVSEFFAGLVEYLVIEFVPKEDSQVQRLLSSRDDIFHHYDIEHFQKGFEQNFELLDRKPIAGTSRTLFLLKRTP